MIAAETVHHVSGEQARDGGTDHEGAGGETSGEVRGCELPDGVEGHDRFQILKGSLANFHMYQLLWYALYHLPGKCARGMPAGIPPNDYLWQLFSLKPPSKPIIRPPTSA